MSSRIGTLQATPPVAAGRRTPSGGRRLAAAHQPAAEERRRSSTAASTRGSSGSTSTSPSSSASNGTSPSTSTSASTSSTGSSSGPTVASVAERLLHPSGGAHPDPTRPSRNTAVDHQYQWFLDEWDKGFVEGREEAEGYFLECIQGSVPADLTGTLFRNGPGKFKVGGQEIGHPYDGDALITSVAFKDGRAFCRSRFVQTAEYLAEAAEQRILFRGTFATQRPGGPAANFMDVFVKNTSNTNVVHWSGRLLSLFEAGQPYRLDPATLQTQCLETLGGQVQPGLPFDLGSDGANAGFAAMTAALLRRRGAAAHLPPELLAAGGDAVTAHPHVDSNTGRLVTFSYKVGPSIRSPPLPPYIKTDLTFLEYDADWGLAARRSYRLDGFAFLHDMAVTRNYYVLFQNPVTVDNVPYVLGRAPAAACVRWVPGKPTLMHLVPRPGATDEQGAPLRERTFELPPLFIFHHANAFEEGGRLVVDSIHYDSLPAVGREALAEQQIDPDVAFRSRLRRVELDLGTGQLRIASVFDKYLEMVAINEGRLGRRTQYVYGYQSVFDQPQIGLAKVDMEAAAAGRGGVQLWHPGLRTFCLEPKFVPRPGATAEDDGWLLSVAFSSETLESSLLILDARRLQEGPVATLRFRAPVPSGLHGCWTPTYYGPEAA